MCYLISAGEGEVLKYVNIVLMMVLTYFNKQP